MRYGTLPSIRLALCGMLALTYLPLYFGVISAACLLTGQAVEISISGHSMGQGLQNLSFSGDLMNVSIMQNGAVWNITAVGGA